MELKRVLYSFDLIVHVFGAGVQGRAGAGGLVVSVPIGHNERPYRTIQQGASHSVLGLRHVIQTTTVFVVHKRDLLCWVVI